MFFKCLAYSYPILVCVVCQVITGVALVSLAHGINLCWGESTAVTFKPFSRETVREYMKLVSVLDKAGAYGIQEWIGYIGVERIEGSYFNVVGLPVQRLYQELKQFVE